MQYKFEGQLLVEEVFERGENRRKPIQLSVLGRDAQVTERFVEFVGTLREVVSFVEANEAKFERITVVSLVDKRVL